MAGAAADPAARAAILADLRGWAARYPVLDPAPFPALAMTISAHLPAARRADRALAALVSLWIIAFDALVDEGAADAPAPEALAAHFAALAGGDPPAPPPPPGGAAAQLDAALRECRARLAAYDPPPALLAWWSASLRATIAAIARQRAIGRAGGPPPGYDAILPLLLDSIGARPYLATGAIVGREPGLAARLPALAALAGECALAIRLANDLRTWPKDEREGGINTVVAARGEIARADPALPPAAAHGRALATIAARLAAGEARCRALAAAPGGGAAEAAMARVTAVTVGIYAVAGYDTDRAAAD